MSLFLSETFRDRLAAAPRPLAGGWVCSGSPLVAEIVSGAIKVEAKYDAASVHALVKTVEAN